MLGLSMLKTELIEHLLGFRSRSHYHCIMKYLIVMHKLPVLRSEEIIIFCGHFHGGT